MREIAGEIFLVPVKGKLAQLNHLFVLNPVGIFIWENLDGRRDLAAVRGLLVERFEVSEKEAREDLEEYVGELLKEKLIEPVTDPGV